VTPIKVLFSWEAIIKKIDWGSDIWDHQAVWSTMATYENIFGGFARGVICLLSSTSIRIFITLKFYYIHLLESVTSILTSNSFEAKELKFCKQVHQKVQYGFLKFSWGLVCRVLGRDRLLLTCSKWEADPCLTKVLFDLTQSDFLYPKGIKLKNLGFLEEIFQIRTKDCWPNPKFFDLDPSLVLGVACRTKTF